MAIPSIFLNFLFPPPPSLFVTTMSVIGISSLANAGFMEIKGKHMQYSKFLNEGVAKKENGAKLSSRNGMLLAYTPAFVVGLSSLLAFPDQDLRFLLLASSLTVHFLKRVLEVLFLHKYSGSMGTICYLMGRSYATREWYISKFGDKFPKDVKAFIPYVF
ncbi:putative 3-oxo-5-alpha-steroid 4-dehydrogenase/very-long-chain enoyl-CoA reductase [Helianthus annuus]|uniref:3-oxo-5-alpha-steroid 4-dehydrogenase/very-long-chain enoyl-CoA reductase n=1 Tax=Helianthus annuus TaxID=4232 RepID=A0A9K3HG63_HELAN|nr:putative 3-oxo-5-alpha-steroid 4-dehydrogenase/very-long-chain enoyl-CoA reductase [Helianthus annuus]KAJ0862491.1 putative 3-oxo-5-alpha-steroid 4-dehydrogenase/very-long-chain enoyl-CoA reductase [Helianthus annuus]